MLAGVDAPAAFASQRAAPGPAAGFLLRSSVRPAQRAGASAVWCVGGEQGVGIAGIHKTGTPGAQQSFHLLGCFLDHTARLAGLNLAPQLDKRLSGVVQTPCQDCCNVNERPGLP